MFAVNERLIISELTMSLQAIEPYADDDQDAEQHEQWLEYCHVASTIDRTRILEVVLSDLDAEDSPLYPFIDDALHEPHEPGRARDSITKLAALGQAILNVVARAVDDQVNLRMAVEVPHV
jgi:hypothetical protein